MTFHTYFDHKDIKISGTETIFPFFHQEMYFLAIEFQLENNMTKYPIGLQRFQSLREVSYIF